MVISFMQEKEIILLCQVIFRYFSIIEFNVFPIATLIYVKI